MFEKTDKYQAGNVRSSGLNEVLRFNLVSTAELRFKYDFKVRSVDCVMDKKGFSSKIK